MSENVHFLPLCNVIIIRSSTCNLSVSSVPEQVTTFLSIVRPRRNSDGFNHTEEIKAWMYLFMEYIINSITISSQKLAPWQDSKTSGDEKTD